VERCQVVFRRDHGLCVGKLWICKSQKRAVCSTTVPKSVQELGCMKVSKPNSSSHLGRECGGSVCGTTDLFRRCGEPLPAPMNGAILFQVSCMNRAHVTIPEERPSGNVSRHVCHFNRLYHSNLLRHSIAQLHPHPRTSQDVDPQPLRITQPIILRLDLREHHLLRLRVPQEQIRHSPTPLLVFLRHHLTDSSQSFPTETLNDLHKVLEVKCPVNSNCTGLPFEMSIVNIPDETLSRAIGYLRKAMIDF
jgi:hypothetical protein